MRILLDNCVPRKLARLIPGHTARTAVEERLAHLSDKALLDAMAGKFDALITVDRGIEHQQNMTGRAIVVGLIMAKSNSIGALAPHVDELVRRLEGASPGTIVTVP